MSTTTAGVLVVLLAASTVAQTPPLPATDVSSADIQAFINGLPHDAVSDRPIRVVEVGGYHVGVYGVLRPKTVAQEANRHDTKVTEIYYILEGNATLVRGVNYFRRCRQLFLPAKGQQRSVTHHLATLG